MDLEDSDSVSVDRACLDCGDTGRVEADTSSSDGTQVALIACPECWRAGRIGHDDQRAV